MVSSLSKAASYLPLAVPAAMFVCGIAVPSAQASDLRGECCADLEERVAELEATTARKGDRKMGVTITGQVNKMVMWWDDGQSSKTYYGVENRNISTRFYILGEAKVTRSIKIGFEIMLDNQTASSASLNQWDADGKNNGLITPLGAPSFTGNNNDNYFGAARHMIFWVEDAKLGRVSVGHYEMAGAVRTLDLGGISAGAIASMSIINGNFLIRGPAGQYYATKWLSFLDPAANGGRQNELRYDGPAIMGFIFSSSIAEDGSNWGTMLRYANEFSGVRVAAGIGYEHYGEVTARADCVVISGLCANPPGYGPANLDGPAPNVNSWGAGVSVLHIPSGLFAQGHYLRIDFDEDSPTTPAPYLGQLGPGRIPADQWLIQAGITKNWFGFGNTAFFAEYGQNSGWGAGGGPLTPNGISYSNLTTPGAQAVNGVTNSEVTMYGFGVTQHVDAAPTELYLDARHFSADITCSAANNCSGAAGSAPGPKLQPEDFWAVIGGARVTF